MMSYEDAVKTHIEKFGVEPIITGANYWQSNNIPELIRQAVENEIPYIEGPVDWAVFDDI